MTHYNNIMSYHKFLENNLNYFLKKMMIFFKKNKIYT